MQVYLEPGEACVLNAGYLVTKVLDTFKNGTYDIAIVDFSAACHMPDILECHFLPPLLNASTEGITYRLGGPPCLLGYLIGEYFFSNKLKENDLKIFGKASLYSTCKKNTFYGMPLPDIYILNKDYSLEELTSFSNSDFKYRLERKKKEDYL